VTPGERGVVTEWLAVFRTATDVQELDADTTAVKAIVGGAIVVSPVNCFDGLRSMTPGRRTSWGSSPRPGNSWTRSSSRWIDPRCSSAGCERCASTERCNDGRLLAWTGDPYPSASHLVRDRARPPDRAGSDRRERDDRVASRARRRRQPHRSRGRHHRARRRPVRRHALARVPGTVGPRGPALPAGAGGQRDGGGRKAPGDSTTEAKAGQDYLVSQGVPQSSPSQSPWADHVREPDRRGDVHARARHVERVPGLGPVAQRADQPDGLRPGDPGLRVRHVDLGRDQRGHAVQELCRETLAYLYYRVFGR
jgi:hypothetical protein